MSSCSGAPGSLPSERGSRKRRVASTSWSPTAVGSAARSRVRILRAPIDSGRLRIYPQSSTTEVLRLWVIPPEESLSRLVVVDGAGTDLARRRFFAEIRDGIEARERDHALDTGAVLSLGPMVVENVLLNLAAAYPAWPDGLDSAFAGVPALVVSAGPSLDENLALVDGAAERGLVIAVDTAVKPLLGRGVEPHIVVAVDPRERNVHNVEGAALERSLLVAEVSVHPRLLSAASSAAARTLVVADNAVGGVLESLGAGLVRLPMLGSVATAAFELACRVEADPIVFFGQDLAFTGGKEYCSNLSAGSVAPAFESEHRVEDDLHGRPVGTTTRLQCFRDYLETRMLAIGGERTFVNATGAGILKRGVRQIATFDELRRLLGPVLTIRRQLTETAASVATARNPRGPSALESLAAETRRARRCLESGRGDSLAALRAYLEHPSTVALVEMLEAGELLALQSRSRALSAEKRSQRVLPLLERGCRTLEERIAVALAPRGASP